MKTKKIPTKNYILMSIITILVIVVTFYIAEWYKIVKDYKTNNSIITSVINEVDAESLSSYLLENPNAIIYLAASNDDEVKNFEKKFKKIIINNELNDSIIYFDTRNISEDELNKLFLTNISPTIKIKKIVEPNILYFDAGEIVDALYIKKSKIKIDNVKKLLERNNVIDND